MAERNALLIGAIGAVVGAAATILTGAFGYFNKDRELDIRMVDVGLAILRGERADDEQTLPARQFALRLLRKYADVEIPDNEFDAWAQSGVTPFYKNDWGTNYTYDSSSSYTDYGGGWDRWDQGEIQPKWELFLPDVLTKHLSDKGTVEPSSITCAPITTGEGKHISCFVRVDAPEGTTTFNCKLQLSDASSRAWVCEAT